MEKMNADERLAKKFLESKYLSVQRFTPENNISWGGTAGFRVKLPDFKVSRKGNSCFYAEVKSLQAVPENESSSFNMYNKHMSEAIKQFEVVNKKHQVPNVLIWVNHGGHIVQNLEIMYAGVATMSDGEIVGGFQRYSEGKLKQKKRFIDLHIWLNTNSKDGISLLDEPSWFFSGDENCLNDKKMLSRLFDLRIEDF